MSDLEERARALLERWKSVGTPGWKSVGTALRQVTPSEMIRFLEAVIPALEKYDNAHTENISLRAELEARRGIQHTDKAEERRTLAIFEAAVRLYQQAPSNGDTIFSSTNNTEGRIEWAVKTATAIYDEVKRRSGE